MECGEYLYDLDNDPGETSNLATDFPEVFNELKTIHKNWREEINLTNNKK